MKCRFGSITLTVLVLVASHATAREERQAALPPPAGTIRLEASSAKIHGQTARFEVLEGVGNICYWTDPKDWLSWELTAPRDGEYVLGMK